MTNKIINHLIYSSIFVSIISSFLSTVPPIFLDSEISVNKTLLIFFGTLLIYNIDHIKDIRLDKKTNPERTEFIQKNKKYLLILIFFSVVATIFLILRIDYKEILILLPVFIIGIFHWKLKKNKILSVIYITLSWTVVVTIFPLIEKALPSKNLFLIIITFGLTFFANVSVFVASEYNHVAVKKTVYFAKLITFLGLILVLLASSEMKYLIFIPGLTLIALNFYKTNERYNLFFMDGALLVGGILAVLSKEFFTSL